jgi:dienelactone hydrolase
MKHWHLAIAASALACAAFVHTTPALAEFKTQAVDYKQGEAALEGYLAYDTAGPAKRGGILVLHHRDGLDEFTKEQTRVLAHQGYVVFAADIFGKGVHPKTVEEMTQQSGIYNKDRRLMQARAQAGLDVLRKNPLVEAARVGVLGYCFGGTVAVELAETGAPLTGTVSIHGSFRDFTPGAAQKINGRMLILHGAEDPTAPLKEVNLLIDELRKTKVDWELELYAGAHHGFSRPSDEIEARANVRSVAARDKFFGEVLR